MNTSCLIRMAAFTKALCALAVLAVLSLPLHATYYEWTGSQSTDYANYLNYVNYGQTTPPGTGDILWYTKFNFGTYQGNVGTTVSSIDSSVGGFGNMTAYDSAGAGMDIDFTGHTLDVSGAGMGRSRIEGTTIWRGGTWNNNTEFAAGQQTFSAAYSPVVTTITGASSALNVTGQTSLGYYAGTSSIYSSATLNVESGAAYSASSVVYLGNFNADYARAALNVTDGGRTADLNGNALVIAGNANGTSTVHVSNGGVVTDAGVTYIADNSGTSGALQVEGAGSSFSGGNIVVGSSGSAVSAQLRAQSGGSATSSGNVTTGTSGASIYVGSGSTLTATNVYVNQGDTVDGSDAILMGSGAIQVNATGGDIALNGVINVGDTPSASGVGTLTLGSVTFATDVSASTNSLFTFDLNSTSSFDKIAIFGDIAGTGGSLGNLVLNFNFSDPGNTQYILFTTTGSASGVFDNVTWNGGSGNITYGADSIYITTAAVPEPSTFVLLGLSAGVLACRWKRRRSA